MSSVIEHSIYGRNIKMLEHDWVLIELIRHRTKIPKTIMYSKILTEVERLIDRDYLKAVKIYMWAQARNVERMVDEHLSYLNRRRDLYLIEQSNLNVDIRITNKSVEKLRELMIKFSIYRDDLEKPIRDFYFESVKSFLQTEMDKFADLHDIRHKLIGLMCDTTQDINFYNRKRYGIQKDLEPNISKAYAGGRLLTFESSGYKTE